MNNVREEGDVVGAFVRVTVSPYDALGIGKLTRVLGRQAVVTYFDVPDDLDPMQAIVPFASLRVVDLPTQTRVYHLDETTGRWRVGRVLDGEGRTLLVQFPNDQTDNLPRSEVYARWRKPIADPVVFLARRVNETPLFADARSEFVRAVVAQRAASLGMGAILSSAIQLVHYQFNVIRRVLQDPVQRYLLADEVGLGKTIEAGVLIRQYVMDEPATARVLVVTPRPLVEQWKQELATRFSLTMWLDEFVQVIASDDLGAVERQIAGAGMLVVDEAHHLSRLGADGRNHLYDLLTAKAPDVRRLLLLSATPVLSDAAGFLRVLHLLDPVVFPLNDLSGFEQRLQSRQLIAEAASALIPENVLSMEDDLDRLEATFHNDSTLVQLIAKLRPIVQALPEDSDASFLGALGALRSHLSETYKLHRRILRNRRKSVPWATPRRSGVRIVEYECVVTGERYRALDSLRGRLANVDAPAGLHLVLLGAAVHPEAAPSIVGVLRSAGVNDSPALELAQRVDDLAAEARTESARVQALTDIVKGLVEPAGLQVVVFCDRAADADLITTVLQSFLPKRAVQRHDDTTQSGEDQEEGESNAETWHVFLSDPVHCRVLVCDARAEEGLNLHGGRKVAVHYDLPPSPNRIEQRLGRLDRYGTADAIKSVALVCRDNRDEKAWLTCLDQGLQIFGGSIASLQYLIEESLRSTADAWAGEGSPALTRWCEQLEGPSGWAVRERRRIDQQDALDALSETQSDAFDALEELDDEWQAWRRAFDGFAQGVLQFERRPERWTGALPPMEQVFRLGYVRNARASTLMTLNAFMAEFLGTIDTEAAQSSSKSPLTFAYAYRRGTAVSKEGMTRNVKPLRSGDALVESLYSFCESDDRGRVYAMWRHMPTHSPLDASGVDLIFRFDFLIQADLIVDEATGDDEMRALRRRVEGHFPPRFLSVWVLPDGSCTTEPPLALKHPYTPRTGSVGLGEGRDYNLNAKRWQVLDLQSSVPWLMAWSQHCERVRVAAATFVLELDEFKASVRIGLNQLREQHEVRVGQLTSRAARLAGSAREAELADLDAEHDQHQRLTRAVTSPFVRTDAVGAVFVSPTCPFPR